MARDEVERVEREEGVSAQPPLSPDPGCLPLAISLLLCSQV